MFAGWIDDGITLVITSRINDGNLSPYTTEILPGDNALVQKLKTDFKKYEERNWRVQQRVLEENYLDCAEKGLNPDQYLYIQLQKNFGPGRGGLSPHEYEDFRRAVEAARELDHDPKTADLILKMAQSIVDLYERLVPLSHRYEHHHSERVDAIVGKFDDLEDGRRRFISGMRSVYKEDIEREKQFVENEKATGNPYGGEPREITVDYLEKAMREPSVKRTIYQNTTLLNLKYKNRLEFAALAGLNKVKQARYKVAEKPGSSTNRFLYHTEELAKTIFEMTRLLIQDYGRVFDENFNGADDFVGLKNRTSDRPGGLQDNLHIFFELLRISDPAILQCSKDHFSLRHISFDQKQFLEMFSDLGLDVYNIGYNAENPENNILQIIYENGIDDPRVPQIVRDAVMEHTKLFVESERQQAFESMKEMPDALSGNFADSYVFRSVILKNLELPAFGKALRKMMEASVKILGEEGKKNIETSFKMMAHYGSEYSNGIMNIINIYYRKTFINTLHAAVTNPRWIDTSMPDLSIEAYIRRYLVETLLLDDMAQQEEIILSEWLENPNDAFKNLILPDTFDKLGYIRDKQILQRVHGYKGFGKQRILAEMNDKWWMFVHRKLVEMDKLHKPLKDAPTGDNISYAIDWQNEALELLNAIIVRSPFLARQNTYISASVKRKLGEVSPAFKAVENLSSEEAINIIYEDILETDRELTRYMERATKKGIPGPGTPNFMFNSAFTPAGGVKVADNLTFCEMGPDGQPRRDAQGRIIFRALLGEYGYRPAAFNHLSNPTEPLTWMETDGGLNVLECYECSSRRTEQFFNWLNAKVEHQNRIRAARGEDPLPLYHPTDIMPMFRTDDPGNPGVVMIGLSENGILQETPFFSNGDTVRAQEYLPRLKGYFAAFNIMGGRTGLLQDPDLYDSTIHAKKNVPFATIARTFNGDPKLTYARVGARDKNGNFTTLPIFTTERIPKFIAAFNSNSAMIWTQLSKKVINQYNKTSSFIQLLNFYMRIIPGKIRLVRKDIYGDEPMGPFPAGARPGIRPTPSENFPDNADFVDLPAQAVERAQRILPIATGIARLFREPPLRRIINKRIVDGDRIVSDIIEKKYEPVARMLGVPLEEAAYSVPPIDSLSKTSINLNGELLEEFFIKEPDLDQFSGEDAAEILQALVKKHLELQTAR